MVPGLCLDLAERQLLSERRDEALRGEASWLLSRTQGSGEVTATLGLCWSPVK